MLTGMSVYSTVEKACMQMTDIAAILRVRHAGALVGYEVCMQEAVSSATFLSIRKSHLDSNTGIAIT